MKSFIAALRTLTLPFGAGPNDERIVLNGVDGRIEIYAVGGVLLMTLDDDGLKVYDSDGDTRGRFGIPGDFATLSLFNADNEAAVISASQGTDYGLLSLQGTDGPKNFPRLLILSPDNTTKNPLFQVDMGILTSDVAQPIIDLTGFTRDDARAAIVAVDELVRASNLGGGNAPTLGNSYPRGSMGKIEDASSSAAFSAATTILSGLNGKVVEAGRRYWVHFFARTVNQSVALDTFELRIERDAGAGFAVISDGAIQLGTAGENIGPINIWASYDPATDATVDFRVRGERTGGTGTLAVGASATSPMYLEIFDAGDAV
jgi:hypothetical protein